MELNIPNTKEVEQGPKGFVSTLRYAYDNVVRHITWDWRGGERIAGASESGVAFHIHYIGSYLSQTGIALKYWPR